MATWMKTFPALLALACLGACGEKIYVPSEEEDEEQEEGEEEEDDLEEQPQQPLAEPPPDLPADEHEPAKGSD